MGEMRKESRSQAGHKLPKPPLDFTLARPVYASQMRRRRNRMYRLVATLLSLAVCTGVVAVLLVNWLSTLVK
jgi:hypothetical protein